MASVGIAKFLQGGCMNGCIERHVIAECMPKDGIFVDVKHEELSSPLTLTVQQIVSHSAVLLSLLSFLF